MAIQKQVNELTALTEFTDTDVVPVHDGNGLKQGTIAQLTENLASKFSNPNLLINPNFSINQRGSSSYSGNASTKTYTVDRWYVLGASSTVTENSDGTITVTNSGISDIEFTQITEKPYTNVTASVSVSSYSGTVKLFTSNQESTISASGISILNDSGSVNTCGVKLGSGASVTLKWFKLEQGSYASDFIEPNIAIELVKCNRFYVKSMFEFSANGTTSQEFGFTIQLNVIMRTTPTINVDKSYYYNTESVSVNFMETNNLLYIYCNATYSQITVIKGVYRLDAEIY